MPSPAFAAPASLARVPASAQRSCPALPAARPAPAATRTTMASLQNETVQGAGPAGSSRTTAAFSSIQNVLTAPPVALPADLGAVVAATYKQVLGNAHVMESEAAELAVAESDFRISRDVREFVRAIASSETWKSRFFDSVSQFRFIELAFKHMLGRAPRDLKEYGEAMAAYTAGGVEGVVGWCVDGEEFAESFGNQIVPYGEYKGCYPTNEQFNKSVAMRGTPCSSDKKMTSKLQYAVCSGDSPSWLSIAKALPAGTEKGTGFCIGGHWTSTQRNTKAPVRVGTKIPGGVVFN